MNMMTMIYTNAMADSVAFYERLGLTRDGDGDVDQWWNQFSIGGAVLALHWGQDQPVDAGTNPELHLKVDAADVDRLFDVCRQANIDMSPEVTTLAGINQRTFFVTDPNGIKVFIDG